MRKQYIISGLKPAEGGTGDFLSYLLDINHKFNFKYELLTPEKNTATPSQRILKVLVLLYRKFRRRFFYYNDRLIFEHRVFYNRVKKIRGADIIFLHPQTLGFRLLIDLIKNKNRIKLYVLDNSFFCIKSYNYHEIKQECLQCVNFENEPYSDCKSFPYPSSRNQTLQHLKSLKKYSDRIEFFAQNISQSELIKKHFGSQTTVTVIGMWTQSLEKLRTEMKSTQSKKIERPNILFHGATIEPKGHLFFLKLAKLLPDFDFIMPIPSHYMANNLPKNVFLVSVNWDNGLKDLVQSVDLVLCPSLWSAANEAALIKSIMLSRKVAVVSLEHSFEKTIPADLLLRLSKDVKSASKQISSFLYEPEYNEPNSTNAWILSYLDECNLKAIFE